jgi:hypothetical protein
MLLRISRSVLVFCSTSSVVIPRFEALEAAVDVEALTAGGGVGDLAFRFLSFVG